MLGSDHILIHLITICMGLIIAFGLQQIVDHFLRRRRARKLRDSENARPPSSNDTLPPTP